MFLRITLTNTHHNPTREEISSHDRRMGEQALAGLPIEWAGWVVLNDQFKLSAQWLVFGVDPSEVMDHLQLHEIEGYRFNVYQSIEDENEEIQLV